MRSFTMLTAALAALTIPVAAQTCGTASLGTVTNGGTSFGVGGGNYFDANVTNPLGLVVCAIDTKTTASVSTPVTVEIYLTPGTYVGNHTNASVWRLVATGTGVGVGSGPSMPLVPVTLAQPFYLAPGSHGVFVRIVTGGGPQYVSGANTFSNADLTLTLGASQSSPFTSGLATPRTWNGVLYYTPGGQPNAAGVGLSGLGCPGSLPTSTIEASTPPVLGQSMNVTIDNLPLSVAILMLGFSNTTSPFGPLPLDLTPFNAPGCFGRVSPDATFTLIGTNNAATFTLAVPNTPSLAGLLFHMQALVVDPPANALGAVFSDSATAVIGS